MAGIINTAQVSNSGITPESVRAKMQLPPELKNAYERIVLAGKKVMYSEQTHSIMQQQLAGPGPIAQKLGVGVSRLLVMLINESKGSLPPSVLIPAGTELVAEAADFLKKSGQPVSDQDIGEAMSVMVEDLLKTFGMNPAKMQAALSQATQGGGAAGIAPKQAPQPAPAPAASGA
jgi:hypothetical protein